jgi:hypothetical protein
LRTGVRFVAACRRPANNPDENKLPACAPRSGQTPGALDPAGYDYFVFVPPSDPHLTGPRIRTIFHDDKTQATIIAIAHD